MRDIIRRFLLVEGASFAAASLVHGGVLLTGYEHRQASIAEGSIACLLLMGLGLSWVWPARTRLIGLAVQAAALFGTLVGVFTIAIGVGPRTAPDVAYHLAILAVLSWGLLTGARAQSTPQQLQPSRRRASPGQ